MENSNNNDNLSRFWFAASNMVPPIGIFLYFRHKGQFPKKARKALIAALAGIPIAIVAGYVMNNYILN
ncbi:hypothetical protein [Flavobacterium soli]|uniref:hypothetical protein n=1 Tax=Flavobacterium soli TaxID=344881 RepID=UPI00047EE0B4|nr:hypothetical protein [Flavobacterium soli]